MAFDAQFAPIRGVFARRFPAEGGFGLTAVEGLKFPVQPAFHVQLEQPQLPELRKNARPHPRLKPVVGRRSGPQAARQGFPLDARAQHVENGKIELAIRAAGPSAPPFRRERQERFERTPERFGRQKSRVNATFVVGCR